MRKFKRYAEKKLEAKDQHLKEFYSVAASAFNTLEMFRGLSALTAKMIEKERNAVHGSSSDEADVTTLMREMNLLDITDEYEPSLRAGQFLMLYSFCESRLLKVCRCFYPVTKLPLKVEDLAGSNIGAAPSYLSKVVGIPLPFFFSPNAEGEFMRSVRNKLAHTGGWLGEKDALSMEAAKDKLSNVSKGNKYDQLRQRLANSYLTMTEGNETRIVISDKFNKTALVLMTMMFTAVLQSSEKKMSELVGNSR